MVLQSVCSDPAAELPNEFYWSGMEANVRHASQNNQHHALSHHVLTLF